MVVKDRGFQGFLHVFFIVVSLACVLPFVLLLMSSITDETALVQNGYSFFPAAFSFDAYKYLLLDSTSIVKAYMTSIFVTVVGTSANLLLTTLLAYPLSRPRLPGKNIVAFYVFFTMLFNGGLVPTYMMWTGTFGITNTYLALILPNLMLGAFYIIMMRTYFTANVPEAIVEAARIDGAGEFRVLAQVVLPMSIPILATLALLVGLNYWNDWMNGLYYIRDDSKYTIQVLLYQMLMEAEFMKSSVASSLPEGITLPTISMRMAVAALGSIPMLLVYPFFQKFFVKGITIGAVKG